MKLPAYYIFLFLMLLGNCIALYKMFTARQQFLTQFPGLTETAFTILRILPLVNILALAGLWYLQPWAACLAITCGIIVIAIDIHFGIYYHLYVAIPSTLILLFFIMLYWKEFK